MDNTTYACQKRSKKRCKVKEYCSMCKIWLVAKNFDKHLLNKSHIRLKNKYAWDQFFLNNN